MNLNGNPVLATSGVLALADGFARQDNQVIIYGRRQVRLLEELYLTINR